MKKIILLSIVSLVALGTLTKKEESIQKKNLKDVGSTEKIISIIQSYPTSSAIIRDKNPELINEVRNLSNKIMQNTFEKKKLQDLLANQELQQSIRNILTDKTNLNKANFKKRLHALDVTYEGLKQEDQNIQQQYLEIAKDILTQTPGKNIKNDPAKYTQFNGDRVELVFFASKIGTQQKESFKAEILKIYPATKTYFDQAKQLESTYQVAL